MSKSWTLAERIFVSLLATEAVSFDLTKLRQDEFVGAIASILAKEQMTVSDLESFHPRAVKLMRKKKPFIVVANDEPYFEMVYHQIKLEELLKGTWTDEDERVYQSCVSSI
jgi:hypothetical protein